ncbi:MAG: dihydroorotase [Kiritimatiellaeota bacterium]|nr:dihydroorotase [Kiritimatiellota bacterium]
MSRTLVLRGARVIDPASDIDEIRDLAVVGDQIAAPESLPGAEVLDFEGLVVAPGFVDLHVHFRDPGQTWKEDALSGTRAAAAGGFTAVLAMPNTTPPIDSPALLRELLDHYRRCAVVRVFQSACITRGRRGRVPTDAAALKAAGAAALTDDGSAVPDAGVLRQAMQAAKRVGLPILEHCEDPAVVGGGVLHDGETARGLGLPGTPAVSEELIVARDTMLARETGCSLHVQHVSCAGSVELVRRARAAGAPVTAEVTPHHLAYTDAACLEFGPNARMNPPLRTEQDRSALIEGLSDGTISVIATDHAPHAAREKDRPFPEALAGIIGLEAAVPVCLTELVHTGVLTLSELVARFTVGPRHVLGLPQTRLLRPGSPADLTVIDPDAEFALDISKFHSRSRNCPYHGRRCRGRPVATMVGGRWVWSLLPQISGAFS